MKRDINGDLVFLKVLQILTQDTSPSSDLISTVKRLYETKFRVCIAVKIILNFFTNDYFFCFFFLFVLILHCRMLQFLFHYCLHFPNRRLYLYFLLLPFYLYSCLVSFKICFFICRCTIVLAYKIYLTKFHTRPQTIYINV